MDTPRTAQTHAILLATGQKARADKSQGKAPASGQNKDNSTQKQGQHCILDGINDGIFYFKNQETKQIQVLQTMIRLSPPLL